ncbi:hypothetical protein J8631_02495 [Serratia fonticola]|nr:hypothetical protein [Serratia fonticola]MBP1034421.1 hypothetical protein [Serratia fonticola]
MSCKTLEDLRSVVFGDILLHTFLEQRKVDEVKQFVLKEAIQLVSAIEHVSWDVAETLLLQVLTDVTRQVLGNEQARDIV